MSFREFLPPPTIYDIRQKRLLGSLSMNTTVDFRNHLRERWTTCIAMERKQAIARVLHAWKTAYSKQGKMISFHDGFGTGKGVGDIGTTTISKRSSSKSVPVHGEKRPRHQFQDPKQRNEMIVWSIVSNQVTHSDTSTYSSTD